jgi:hypothetical protein
LNKEKGKEITGVWAGIWPLAHVHGGLWLAYYGRPHRPPIRHAAHMAGPTRLAGRAQCVQGAVTVAVAGTAAELTTAHKPMRCYGRGGVSTGEERGARRARGGGGVAYRAAVRQWMGTSRARA